MAREKKVAPAISDTEAMAAGQDQAESDAAKLSAAERRREYQRRYYQMHKEKAKEYQRQYNLTHKKKLRGGRGKNGMASSRDAIRHTFNTSDIMHSPVEKAIWMLEKIIKGERLFTM